MADVYNYNTLTGVITIDAGVIKTQVEDEYKAIFGEYFSVDERTPQGIFIAAEIAARISVADNNAAIANQINPNQAGGINLDALGALTATFRKSNSKTSVLVTLSGIASTPIAKGAQLSETVNGVVFESTLAVVLPASGTLANVPFQAVQEGPIPCLANTLTVIVSDILGLETATNPDAGVIGSLTQSDVSFRNTRNVSLAGLGSGSIEAINAALMMTEGVTSTNRGLQNVKSTVETINGVIMQPHSIYFCIAGTATEEDIAIAFTRSKGGGSDYNNGYGIPVVYSYQAPLSSQVIDIKWDNPSQIFLTIRVTVQSLPSVQNLTTAIKNAVLTYASGEVSDMPGFTVSTDASPSQIASAISKQIPGVFIEKVEIGVNSFTQKATLTSGSTNVTGLTYTTDITAGMSFTGAGIPSSTTVVGAPGSNSFTMSNNATITGDTILTFNKTVSYQTTTIPIAQWQQAATLDAYIIVVVV